MSRPRDRQTTPVLPRRLKCHVLPVARGHHVLVLAARLARAGAGEECPGSSTPGDWVKAPGAPAKVQSTPLCDLYPLKAQRDAVGRIVPEVKRDLEPRLLISQILWNTMLRSIQKMYELHRSFDNIREQDRYVHEGGST